MSKNKITNKELKSIGIKDPDDLKIAGKTVKELVRKKVLTVKDILNILRQVIENPEEGITDNPQLLKLCKYFSDKKKSQPPLHSEQHRLRDIPPEYTVYGEMQIDTEALKQMHTAMRLPITKAGALMPDAHTGYGLPIGGVLATTGNVIIPYAVGVDIACRMCMSVFDISPKLLEEDPYRFKKLLGEHTHFGVGSTCKKHLDDSVFERSGWSETKIIRSLRDLAYSQLGTSGAGNHFVEWGILEINSETALLGIHPGKYIALLSHSGSRGFGNEIATHYSRVARQMIKLPHEAEHLAWLDLYSEEGQEYWIAMNLAGEYASENHHEIHKKIAADMGMQPLSMIENHHNFAWKEKLTDGTEVIVHRKGATPAGTNNIGIIPGSMASPGFIIRGKGNPGSINSASHGAGRIMSRSKAFHVFTRKDLDAFLKEKGVTLIGGDIDEAPMVYKSIEAVMESQKDLVEILARFTPFIVRMAEPERRKKR
jgi:tRNA-splicing ligase RtcB (3'-phosphate/5'-hydroxy nucleic acid ligase)